MTILNLMGEVGAFSLAGKQAGFAITGNPILQGNAGGFYLVGGDVGFDRVPWRIQTEWVSESVQLLITTQDLDPIIVQQAVSGNPGLIVAQPSGFWRLSPPPVTTWLPLT